MTPEQIANAREIIAAATPGPWASHTEPYENWRDALNWFDQSIAKGVSPKTHFVLCEIPDPDGSGYLVPALTGNGPTSMDNATFIAAARTGWPEALDEIERLQYRYDKYRETAEQQIQKLRDENARYIGVPVITLKEHQELAKLLAIAEAALWVTDGDHTFDTRCASCQGNMGKLIGTVKAWRGK